MEQLDGLEGAPPYCLVFGIEDSRSRSFLALFWLPYYRQITDWPISSSKSKSSFSLSGCKTGSGSGMATIRQHTLLYKSVLKLLRHIQIKHKGYEQVWIKTSFQTLVKIFEWFHFWTADKNISYERCLYAVLLAWKRKQQSCVSDPTLPRLTMYISLPTSPFLHT